MLFILFELTFNFISSFKTPPHIAVGIDHSASMAVKDKAGNRPQVLSAVINDPVFFTLQNQFVFKYYTFANNVNPANIDDSLSFTGDVTNITNSLQYIKNDLAEKNLAGIILLSDGNYNKGGNPIRFAEELGVPVYPIGIGSPEPVPDIAIAGIEYNPYAYINESTPVHVTIRNMGYRNINLPLTLTVNGEKKLTKMINLPPSPSEIKETIDYLPEIPGNNKLVLSFPSQADELSIKNNFRTIYIDVFKAKLNVLLFSGGLSPDISFLKRHIGSSDRYIVNTFIEKSGNGFYQKNENEIDNADMFILLNFPTVHTSPSILNRLLDKVKTQSIPLFIILGKNVHPPKLSLFNEYLPFKANIDKIKEILVFPVLSEEGKNDQVMHISSQNNTALSAWSKLPPVYITHQINQLWPNTKVLAFYKTAVTQKGLTDNNPLIVTRNTGKQESAAVFAYGIWRWDLLMWGVNNDEDVYYNFVNNLLRWLETKQEIKPVQIKTDKQQYNFGEPVKISVEILNESFLPNNRNEIVLSLKHNHVTENIIVNKAGENRYEKIIYLDRSGDFELYLNNEKTTLYTDEVNKTLFSIGEYSSELSNTRLQKALLEGLASTTGGKYIDSDSLFILENTLSGNPRETYMSNSVEFWNNRIILFCVIFSLTLEWFLRKKKGML
ncbi:hypothetical protein JXQ31_11440 [candidate division KSB1 bacterium]|nr:hypothetical protein [candidate division KSB1 bacterium]